VAWAAERPAHLDWVSPVRPAEQRWQCCSWSLPSPVHRGPDTRFRFRSSFRRRSPPRRTSLAAAPGSPTTASPYTVAVDAAVAFVAAAVAGVDRRRPVGPSPAAVN